MLVFLGLVFLTQDGYSQIHLVSTAHLIVRVLRLQNIRSSFTWLVAA